MNLDVHAHIWNTQLDKLDDIVAEMDAVGLDRIAVLPIAPYMSNSDVAALVARRPDRLIGFASVVPFAQTTGIPRRDPVEELRYAVQELGLRGLKLHPLIQGFPANDPGLVPIMNAAAELGVPVLLHTGPSFGRAGRVAHGHIHHIDDLAIMCPDTIIIAGHADPIGDAPYIARKHPNVYLETSLGFPRYASLIPGAIRQAVDIAGAEKILFGTDFSLGKGERVTDVRTVLESAGLREDELQLIYSANAERILRPITGESE